ncbi:MAG: apolipoprotein N-acyltransferase [Ignavibacteriales bacterium]|nr:MAG: apolipoprotein N-acyltransferase [Ignavibacteriales bacterium]
MWFSKKNKIVLTPEEKKKLKQQRIKLIISGTLLGISFPPFPFPFSLLMFGALIPFFSVIRERKTLAELNRATYLAFFIFSAITLYWVGSWQATADPYLMISGVMLVFFMPILYMIPTTLIYFSRQIFPNKNTIWFYPLFFITLEYLHMINEMSFPWLTLGSGLAKFLSFIQIADTIGVLGISLVVIFINVILYEGWKNFNSDRKKSVIKFSIAFLIFIFFIVYGFIRINNYEEPSKHLKVGIIQPDIDPWDKWSGGNLDALVNKYLSQSRQAISEGSQLLLWPETALPVYLLNGNHRSTLDSIYSMLDMSGNYLLTGMPDMRYYDDNDTKPPDVKYAAEGKFYYATYNAIYFFSPGKFEVQRYGKMKLVPFGERVPYVDKLPFLGKFLKWGVGLSGWNIGQDTTVFIMKDDDGDTIKVNGLVCYESLYPDFVSSFVHKGAQIITVVTNDSWYGRLSGPFQHKEIAVLRAIENRRSVLRSANGGVSCFINPVGKTIVETEMFQTTHLTVDVPLSEEKTFYTKNPLIVPVLCSAFSVWIAGLFILLRLKKILFKEEDEKNN